MRGKCVRGEYMKIKHLMATIAMASVLIVSACSTADTSENKPEPTATLKSPTPTPENYEGEQRTHEELLAAVQEADPSSSWVENTIQKQWMSGAEFAMESKSRCGLQVFPSFQDAVDNDDGSYYDYWTTLGLYGQLGVVLLDNGTCVEKLSEVIRFPGFPSPDQDYTVLTASKENIKDCIERKSACLLDAGDKLPDRYLSSFNVTSTELEELSSAGFCILLYPSSDIGGRDSCEIEDPNGEFEVANYITQDSSDLDVLRLAAKAPSKTDGIGKYLIYGDGWVVFIMESTEDHEKLFLNMNKVIKGTLVSRY
jgi:hypothetical protein